MVQIQNSMNDVKKAANPQAERDATVKDVLGRIKHKFMIMSGKGGVGKTSTSVNLALALAGLGHQVGIMDVDLHGPDVPRMLGLSGMLELTPERKLKPMPYSANLSAVSIESLSPTKDDAIIWRGPVKYSAIQQFIADVAGGIWISCSSTLLQERVTNRSPWLRPFPTPRPSSSPPPRKSPWRTSGNRSISVKWSKWKFSV